MKGEGRKKEKNSRLAERSEAVMAAGAWVENGEEIHHQHPAVRALLTEELQQQILGQKRRRLLTFRHAVQSRLAALAQREDVAGKGRGVAISVSEPAPTMRKDLQQHQKPRCWNEECTDVSLTGQHGHPRKGRTVSFQDSACKKLARGFSAGPSTTFTTTDSEELKRQRQSQYLTHRRFFMDIEREHVRDHQRHRKHLMRVAWIKAEKEQQRLDEERRLERLKQEEEERAEHAERQFLILQHLRLEEEEERAEKAQKAKINMRYVDALRAQMKERIVQEKLDLPPLCSCGDSFWDSHPETCANNCVFFRNPRAYTQALHSVMLTCKEARNSTRTRTAV
ncbi:coiled-coil domain-containing protein 15 [Denticeps clupeoides]|uniref:Coiled-coil domain containing 15 n=1 Tax=Denticeps clupeoides TaxID=299321 RepID=A0AAY4CB88_9TELE|nr:coiled-coil domain-containing protein 15 [Denticeps clupeoides]